MAKKYSLDEELEDNDTAEETAPKRRGRPKGAASTKASVGTKQGRKPGAGKKLQNVDVYDRIFQAGYQAGRSVSRAEYWQ